MAGQAFGQDGKELGGVSKDGQGFESTASCPALIVNAIFLRGFAHRFLSGLTSGDVIDALEHRYQNDGVVRNWVRR